MSNKMKNRVVVSGMGVIAPGIINTKSLWDHIKNGITIVDKLKNSETKDLVIKFGGEINSFEPENYIEKKQVRRMDRYAQLSAVAAILASNDAGISSKLMTNKRMGVFEGTSLGPLGGTLKYHEDYIKNECLAIHPHLLMTSMMGSGSGFISLLLGCHGPSTTISDGSASATSAIGYAYRQIKHGYLDFAVAGGAESPLTKEIIATFNSARLLSKENGSASEAIKSFDINRNGFLLSEGAAFLILESFKSALERGANIYAEITGFGETTDAYHPTSPQPDGKWIASAMKLALSEASLKPNEIQYLNAHGTATKINDIVESRAIRNVFGSKWKFPFVSSTKPITGHMLGACGAVESVISILSIINQFVPANISLMDPDPECEIKSLPMIGLTAEIKNAMTNNYSFGGRNASLVFSSYKS